MKLYSLIPLILMLLTLGCGSKEAPKTPIKRYPMHGVVEKLDPAAKLATIKHEKIGDWMDAMTMDFPVRDQAEFAKLHVGDKMAATVFVQDVDYWISEIQVEQPADAPSK
jgi:Cu/Ag efflux protein CusF